MKLFNVLASAVIIGTSFTGGGMATLAAETTVQSETQSSATLTRAYYTQGDVYLRGQSTDTAYIRIYVKGEDGELKHLRKRAVESDGSYYVYIADVANGTEVTMVPYNSADVEGKSFTFIYDTANALVPDVATAVLTRAYTTPGDVYLRGQSTDTAYIRIYVKGEDGELKHLRKRAVESDGSYYVYIADVANGTEVTMVPYNSADVAGESFTFTYDAIAALQPATDTAEEKTEFDVVLVSVPKDIKIAVIKLVRQITGLDLKEAKEVVENAPKVLKEGASKEEAEEIKAKLEEVGATVEVN